MESDGRSEMQFFRFNSSARGCTVECKVMPMKNMVSSCTYKLRENSANLRGPRLSNSHFQGNKDKARLIFYTGFDFLVFSYKYPTMKDVEDIRVVRLRPPTACWTNQRCNSPRLIRALQWWGGGGGGQAGQSSKLTNAKWKICNCEGILRVVVELSWRSCVAELSWRSCVVLSWSSCIVELLFNCCPTVS